MGASLCTMLPHKRWETKKRSYAECGRITLKIKDINFKIKDLKFKIHDLNIKIKNLNYEIKDHNLGLKDLNFKRNYPNLKIKRS